MIYANEYLVWTQIASLIKFIRYDKLLNKTEKIKSRLKSSAIKVNKNYQNTQMHFDLIEVRSD